jgi:hypothetical protein
MADGMNRVSEIAGTNLLPAARVSGNKSGAGDLNGDGSRRHRPG